MKSIAASSVKSRLIWILAIICHWLYMRFDLPFKAGLVLLPYVGMIAYSDGLEDWRKRWLES